MTDIFTEIFGSIWAFSPNTDKGADWLDANIPDIDHRETTVMAEHGYAYDIALGMLDAGLTLEDVHSGRIAVGQVRL